MKKIIFLCSVFSSVAFSQDIYLCTAFCGLQAFESSRPSQGINLDVIQASSSVDAKAAFKKLSEKCKDQSTLFHRFSIFARNLGTNSLGADGVFAYDSDNAATVENSCIKLGD